MWFWQHITVQVHSTSTTIQSGTICTVNCAFCTVCGVVCIVHCVLCTGVGDVWVLSNIRSQRESSERTETILGLTKNLSVL